MFSSRVALQASRAAAPRAAIAPRANAASVRSYAQAAPAQSTKPPVALFGVDGTYASALVSLNYVFAVLRSRHLFSRHQACNPQFFAQPLLTVSNDQYTAAAKTSTLESTGKALNTLFDVFKKDPKLPVILHAPTLTVEDKSKIVQELQKHIGGVDKGDTVKNFLTTLAENNRLGILEGVCEKFGTLMGASRGEIDLTITSAAQLDNKTISRLESAVQKSEYVGQGKKLKVTNKVNPEMVGGLIVSIGERTIDLSVASKISRMNKMLTDIL
ncbi:MAG: ATP synthase F0 subcomplex subunit OSCP atp5 [Pycnora praestabilis]|nr:MAG: ATP synthase F0 subcomplex subunit OSCP atp5 [Pycnora praestabilis]